MNTSLAAESYNKGLNDLLLKYAQKFQIAICGSLMAIEPETHSVVNKFLFVQASGEVISYNKKHLFTLANEGKHYSAGTQKVLIHYKGWKILPLICYDIRFPVWCRRTPHHDYDLAIVVASWPEKRSFAWRNLLPARAIENQAFYAAVNRVGEDANAILHSGDSVVLDFRGKALNAAKPFEEKVLTTELNIQDLKIHRKAFRFFDDRDEFQIL
jgi:predicted amidohydrolase